MNNCLFLSHHENVTAASLDEQESKNPSVINHDDSSQDLHAIKQMVASIESRISALEQVMQKRKTCTEQALHTMCMVIEQTKSKQHHMQESFLAQLEQQKQKIDSLQARLEQSCKDFKTHAENTRAIDACKQRCYNNELSNQKEAIRLISQSLTRHASILQQHINRQESRISYQEKKSGKIRERVSNIASQISSLQQKKNRASIVENIGSAVTTGKVICTGISTLGGWLASKYVMKN